MQRMNEQPPESPFKFCNNVVSRLPITEYAANYLRTS